MILLRLLVALEQVEIFKLKVVLLAQQSEVAEAGRGHS